MPAIEIPGGAGAANESSERMDITDGAEVDDLGDSFVNINGFAGYMNAEEVQELRELQSFENFRDQIE